MTDLVKKYRQVGTDDIYEMVQYTLPGERTDENAISTIAKFVLNMNVDSMTSVTNERILDIIRPIPDEWSPTIGKATIEVRDPNDGVPHLMRVGDWVGRHAGRLCFVRKDSHEANYEELPEEEQPLSEFEELREFIREQFQPLSDGELYQAFAEKIARELIRAGWSRKVRS